MSTGEAHNRLLIQEQKDYHNSLHQFIHVDQYHLHFTYYVHESVS